MRLMSVERGLRVLLERVEADRISIMGITSRTHPDHVRRAISSFDRRGLHIPESRIYSYTAPPEASQKSGFLGRLPYSPAELVERTEKIPVIKDSSGRWIIVDHSFETGRTLDHAVSVLVNQGVGSWDIWFYTPVVEILQLMSRSKSPRSGGYLNPIANYDPYRWVGDIQDKLALIASL